MGADFVAHVLAQTVLGELCVIGLALDVDEVRVFLCELIHFLDGLFVFGSLVLQLGSFGCGDAGGLLGIVGGGDNAVQQPNFIVDGEGLLLGGEEFSLDGDKFAVGFADKGKVGGGEGGVSGSEVFENGGIYAP